PGWEPSRPKTVLTDANGNWVSTYSELLTTEGYPYSPGPGDRLIVNFIVNYWSSCTDSSAVLTGASPENVGEVEIPVYDPNRGNKGDLDGNGTINIFDMLEILKILGGRITPPLEERLAYAADLDSNETVNILDLLALLHLLSSAV
ncbi:MAG: dockerin type I domain-containing protein, partial [Gemmatimonadota bacterium]|nr:dockerin type I domain-containing protein [Gemmatimonadota bacterium]